MPLNARSCVVVTVSQFPVFALRMPDTRQLDTTARSSRLLNRGACALAVKLAISRWLYGQLPRSYDGSPGLIHVF